MQTLTSKEVETHFNEALASVKEAPVEITQNGEVVAVLVSNAEYAATEALKEAYVEASIERGFRDIEQDKVKDMHEVFDRILGRT